MSAPGPSWRMKNLGVQLRCPRAFPGGAHWIGADAKVAHSHQWDDNFAPISAQECPSQFSATSATGSWNASHAAERIGDPAWKGEPHDAPGEVEAVTRPAGTQGLMRGIRGWQDLPGGSLSRHLAASWNACWMRRLATAPGCVLGSLSDAGCDRPRRAESGGGKRHPGRAPFAGNRCSWGLAGWQGDCVHSSRMDPPDSEKEL
ncbi:hypothetical protein TcBrA4_0000940 [Trypanosoma cruzi]|nr:hypothetical protein TcBrA4_0000940 [Trypanosoma cruzi]